MISMPPLTTMKKCNRKDRGLSRLPFLVAMMIFTATTTTSLALSTATPSASDTTNRKKHAVVIGAGPAGLCSALVLAQRHNYDVTVLESSQRTDVYDPTKAYPFLIRERGQKLTRLFDGIQGDLEANGIAVEGATEMVSIPADPNAVVDTSPKPINFFVPQGRNFWIRRHEFIRILLNNGAKERNIKVLNGIECTSVHPINDDSCIRICAIQKEQYNNEQEETTTPVTFESSLVIACDGMKSIVRTSLEDPSSQFGKWENGNPKGFRFKKWETPSTGLKFKTIHINSNAKVPVGDGTEYEIPFGVQTFHTIRSRHAKDPRKFISLGLLPSKAAPTRTLNVIRDDSHEIWSIRDGNQLREWFADSFPRFDFSSNSSLVEQAEFDRFASVEGLRLPLCQYSPELYVASPSTSNGAAAVLLVGDAAHCFPPDLGEGVNSGLEDVLALDDALTNHPNNVADMARDYAKQRGPESKAIVRMVRFGAPFQYGQFGGMTSVKKACWVLNFMGRMLLHKMTFGLSPRPVFVEVSDGYKKYSSVMRRADTLTAILWASFASIMYSLLNKLKLFAA
jgi:2-polyprenyl-6-methoxyphenol hydroxylase-like FAD-dependent oxidoreductase